MSRPEAQALGGYYKTPPHLTPLMGSLVNIIGRDRYCALIDPCAGTGEAVFDLAVSMFGPKQLSRHTPFRIYAAELERERYAACALHLKHYDADILHGDAMCVNWGGEANAGFLYLNPPYDPDKEFDRLEHRFLTRFTGILAPGNGILFFVVPHGSLVASAEYLASQYTGLRCYRFPDGDFAIFKQVVLVGQRRTRPVQFVAKSEVEVILSWANNPQALPVLGRETKVITFDTDKIHRAYLEKWELETLDIEGIYEQVQPFMYGKTGDLKLVHGLGMDTDLSDFMGATFPVVLPPRPVHVAIALASGLMNGERITPDDPASGLPDLMVKGTFRKEFKTVEEKRNKEGGITSVIQVQQPELQVSALDMNTWTYFDLQAGIEPNDYTDAHNMNVADLLKRYGQSLVRLMTRQCPPLHDPNNPDHALVLPPTGKTPYDAQQATIVGTLKQLFTDKYPFAGENGFVLGEVGTGKTLISLVIAESLSRRNFTAIAGQLRHQNISNGRATPVSRVLVMCPPHLIQNWREEIASVLPAAAVRVLERLSDVDSAAAFVPAVGDDRPGAGLTFLLMSREMAKLGHSWKSGVGKSRKCPTCGHKVYATNEQIVSGRLRCEHQDILPQDDLARMSLELANLMAVHPGVYDHIERFLSPNHHRLARLVTHRNREIPTEQLASYERQSWLDKACPVTKKLEHTPLGRMIFAIGDMMLDACKAEDWLKAESLSELMIDLFMVCDHPDRESLLAYYALATYRAASVGKYVTEYSTAQKVRKLGLTLFLLMRPHSTDLRDQMVQALKDGEKRLLGTNWNDFKSACNRLMMECQGQALTGAHDGFSGVASWAGEISYRRSYNEPFTEIASAAALIRAFRSMIDLSSFEVGKACNASLFTAVPDPRRFPLADYICQRYPALFDLLVLDEAHEYNTDGSAQERAAHKLSALGKPILALTGTSNNGYSSSMFANMWAFSRRFRREFGREDVAQFVTRYGYRKVRVDADGKAFVPRDFGSMSDRRDTGVSLTMRKIGEAPGILPLFVLKHLLPVSVIIHKEDMDHDLPPMTEIPEPIPVDRDLLSEHNDLRQKLVTAIMTDMRQGKTGSLWGQMAQLPSYLDRPHADTGNTGESGNRRYEIRYPESAGGAIVAAAAPFPSDRLTGKEEWLLDKVESELAEKRPILLFVVNTRSGLGERLQRLLTGQGITTTYLDATKVSAGKRQEWINAQVIAKKRQVLIVNPEAVETGLNNLVYFSTAIWYQNPNCSPITYSQANGRLHRPGQLSDEVRVYFPYYAGTIQELHLALLGHKVAAVRQADGLDISSALVAAGASGGGDVLQTMSVGRALYEMLVSNGTRMGGNNHFAQLNGHHKSGQASRPQLVVTPVIEPVVYQGKPTQMRLLEQRGTYAFATDRCLGGEMVRLEGAAVAAATPGG